MANAYIQITNDLALTHIGEPKHDRRYRARHMQSREGVTLCKTPFRAADVAETQGEQPMCPTCQSAYEVESEARSDS